MKKKSLLKIENYFEVFLIIFLISFFLFLIKSFIMTLFIATIFVFLLYKYYKKLVLKTNNETISAIFLIFLVLTVILLPGTILISSLINQGYELASNSDRISSFLNFDNCSSNLCEKIKSNIDTLDLNFENIILKLENFITSSSSFIFSSISKIFINLFIFILALFFLLKDGEKFLKYIKKIIPMKNDYKNALFLRFKDVSEAVFKDSILVAIIQGFLVGVGFFLFGFSSPIFWGVVSSFFALIPLIGTAIIWFPAVVFLFLNNNLLSAILLLLYGTIIIGLSDNIIRPFMLKGKIKIHPFIIMLSILGGLDVFGFLGIFIGPIIVSLLISVFQLYKLDFN